MKSFHLNMQETLFPESCPVADAIAGMATSGVELRGAVFTRREVVHFILDLAGYTQDKPLHQLRLLEPSFGAGDFLIPAVERLLASWRRLSPRTPVARLGDCIRAVELHRDTFSATRTELIRVLCANGVEHRDAEFLIKSWLINDDFLLSRNIGEFDFVAGNPPYVRQELIPTALIAEYRARYETVFDRADLYIPFVERSLKSLSPGGKLAFICADRWTKNRYGGPLRQLVAKHFHLKAYVDMVGTDAFLSEVTAYPAIVLIAREAAGPTRVAYRPTIDPATLAKLASALVSETTLLESDGVREVENVTNEAEPWILEPSARLDLLRRLEAAFPVLEEAGCRVGIGVATGADKAFIGDYEAMDVEPDRKLPLAMTGDIQSGNVNWRGKGVINPFSPDGGLVDLDAYPRLGRYLDGRKHEIARRHVAKKAPANWYRTIDRIYPELGLTPKLLIPDIKGRAQVVYEGGRLYPHHNLYYVTSSLWDLRALQAVLLSAVAGLFVAFYSTKMRGGYFRYQAQYLRRIRIPRWEDVPVKLRSDLANAAQTLDVAACNRAVSALYGLSPAERTALEGSGC